MEALSVREESRVNVHDNRGNDSMKEEGSERGGRNQGVASLRRRRACVALLELPHRSRRSGLCASTANRGWISLSRGISAKMLVILKYNLQEDASNVAMPKKGWNIGIQF